MSKGWFEDSPHLVHKNLVWYSPSPYQVETTYNRPMFLVRRKMGPILIIKYVNLQNNSNKELSIRGDLGK